MKLFYLEQKGYYLDGLGIDRQFADGGQVPIIYHTAEKAIKRAQSLIKTFEEIYNLKVTLDNEHYPSMGADVLYAIRLEDDSRRTRYEIRVYEIETRL